MQRLAEQSLSHGSPSPSTTPSSSRRATSECRHFQHPDGRHFSLPRHRSGVRCDRDLADAHRKFRTRMRGQGFKRTRFQHSPRLPPSRSQTPPPATRREFLDALRSELPEALRQMQQGNIAPVDLAQAAIGPGMAVFTRYDRVLDSSGGKVVSVREALALINETLGRGAWRSRRGTSTPTPAGRWPGSISPVSARGSTAWPRPSPRPRTPALPGWWRQASLTSGSGKVRLLAPAELAQDWNPKSGLAPDGMGDHAPPGTGPRARGRYGRCRHHGQHRRRRRDLRVIWPTASSEFAT